MSRVGEAAVLGCFVAAAVTSFAYMNSRNPRLATPLVCATLALIAAAAILQLLVLP